MLVTLNASDAETGTPLNLVVTRIPSQAILYLTSDGTLDGNRTRIDAPYNVFEVGTVISQYLDHVISVSSFWGGAPYAGYHPLTILGAPDCSSYGECPQDAPWVADAALYPAVGSRCSTLPADSSRWYAPSTASPA